MVLTIIILSLVMMLKFVRIPLAIVAYFDDEIWQMDVKIAFLNRNLIEDVYMTQPEGFVDPKYVGKICELQKSIYGLKQASRIGICVLMKWSKGLA
jgi:hypothetical protein